MTATAWTAFAYIAVSLVVGGFLLIVPGRKVAGVWILGFVWPVLLLLVAALWLLTRFVPEPKP